MKIPLASVGLTKAQLRDAINTLKSGQLTMGHKVKEFEREMAGYLGVSDFVMVNSGSSANLAIIESLIRPTSGSVFLSPGDEVLVPAIAWPTTVWPILQLGLIPRFADVESQSLGIDLEHAQHLVDENSRIRGIMPIHPLGYSLDGQRLADFAKKNRLILIEDVCESLGSFRGSDHAGTAGFASSFSFYFSHHITTMEGGGIGTNIPDLADDLRSIRSHGWSRDRKDSDSWHKEISSTDKKFTFVSTGFNMRPMEIQAAIGLSEIPLIDTYVERRRAIARTVTETIAPLGVHVIGSETFGNGLEKSHSWMHVPIIAPEEHFDRQRLLSALDKLGVETRPVLTGNFLRQPSVQRFLSSDDKPESFPIAEKITKEGFLVGCHHSLTDSQAHYLGEALTLSLQKARH